MYERKGSELHQAWLTARRSSDDDVRRDVESATTGTIFDQKACRISISSDSYRDARREPTRRGVSLVNSVDSEGQRMVWSERGDVELVGVSQGKVMLKKQIQKNERTMSTSHDEITR